MRQGLINFMDFLAFLVHESAQESSLPTFLYFLSSFHSRLIFYFGEIFLLVIWEQAMDEETWGFQLTTKFDLKFENCLLVSLSTQS